MYFPRVFSLVTALIISLLQDVGQNSYLGEVADFSPTFKDKVFMQNIHFQFTFCLSLKSHFWVGSMLEWILENKCWLRRSVLFFYHSQFNSAAAFPRAYYVPGIQRWIKYSLPSKSSQLTRIDSPTNKITLVGCDRAINLIVVCINIQVWETNKE